MKLWSSYFIQNLKIRKESSLADKELGTLVSTAPDMASGHGWAPPGHPTVSPQEEKMPSSDT